ncbi:kiSS-1 receptor-like [Liolophura sinensis]|uniref:kiSS-1 receptor-like n=1 Tax=Liolophura sinensis TaxID=3198878 RepID=UPI003158E3C2
MYHRMSPPTQGTDDRKKGGHVMAFLENETVFEEGVDGPHGLPSNSDMRIVVRMQCVLLLVGVIGNTLILYLFGKRRECLTYVIAILSLAVKDLLACCIYLPFSIALEAQEFATSSDFVCKCYHFFANVTHNFTMPSLLLISLDRCACVCVGHIQATYYKRAFIAIGIVGVFSLSVSIVPTLTFRVNDGYCVFSVSKNLLEPIRIFEMIMALVFVIDGVVSILIYSVIFGTVLYHKYSSKHPAPHSQLDDMGDRSGESSSSNFAETTTFGDSENTISKRKQLVQLQKDQISLTGVMFALTLLYFIQYFPALFSSFNHVRHVSIAIFLMFQIRFVSNFFVYLCLDATFRRDLKDLLQLTCSRLRSVRLL